VLRGAAANHPCSRIILAAVAKTFLIHGLSSGLRGQVPAWVQLVAQQKGHPALALSLAEQRALAAAILRADVTALERRQAFAALAVVDPYFAQLDLDEGEVVLGTHSRSRETLCMLPSFMAVPAAHPEEYALYSAVRRALEEQRFAALFDGSCGPSQQTMPILLLSLVVDFFDAGRLPHVRGLLAAAEACPALHPAQKRMFHVLITPEAAIQGCVAACGGVAGEITGISHVLLERSPYRRNFLMYAALAVGTIGDARRTHPPPCGDGRFAAQSQDLLWGLPQHGGNGPRLRLRSAVRRVRRARQRAPRDPLLPQRSVRRPMAHLLGATAQRPSLPRTDPCLE
jgi:hypothetical protein